MNVLEDCITFLIWEAWVLFSFYLKQKQRFPFGALLKIPPSSPSMQNFRLEIHE